VLRAIDQDLAERDRWYRIRDDTDGDDVTVDYP
jgi:hypothetical protein